MKKNDELGRIDVHGLSLRGDGHDSNHDRFAVADLAKSLRVKHTNLDRQDGVHRNHQGHVFLVADGVSGGPSPAQASAAAIRSVVEYFLNELPWSHLADGHPVDVVGALEDAFRNAQQELQEAARQDDRGMATTLTLAFVRWPDLFVAHVGDSRAYLVRGGIVRKLTGDHSVAEVKRQLGKDVRPEDENRLWNTVGGHSSQLDPQVEHLTLEVGDTLALLTDGIPDSLSEERMVATLRQARSAEELCDRLVSGPGVDDRTSVVARFLPAEPATVAAVPPPPVPTLDVRRTPQLEVRKTPTRSRPLRRVAAPPTIRRKRLG